MTTPNSRNRLPTKPSRNITGKNTAAKVMEMEITAKKKVNYVHVISGEVMIADHLVKAGDALLFDETATLTASQDSQMIWFDLP